MEERTLVKQVLAGNQAAFQLLIRQYQKLVGHMVWRMVSNPEDREEICQDVFIKVYDSLGTFKFDSKLSTWIATIAYRMSLNHIKRSNRNKETEDLDLIDFKMENSSDVLEENDYAKFIHQLIDQLPDTYKTILTLYHLEGFSYPEIVEVTGLPEGTVKSYLFRARKKLKELSEPLIGIEIHDI
ncbi:MAG: RNA polymerase sigma factor [Bacteroidota bacterium]